MVTSFAFLEQPGLSHIRYIFGAHQMVVRRSHRKVVEVTAAFKVTLEILTSS